MILIKTSRPQGGERRMAMQYSADKIRNISLIGHGGDGKTSLAEAMMYYTKGIDRMGKTADGTTVCDFDPEEIKRKISISAAVAPVEWNGYKINVLDTPGYLDFEGEVLQALSASDSAVIVVSGKSSSVHYATQKAFKLTRDLNLPAMIYITRLDEENSDFHRTFDRLKETFDAHLCAVNVPIMKDGKAEGFVDLLDMKGKKHENGITVEIPIPEDMKGLVADLRRVLDESVAETSDELMEKFFADEPFTTEEIQHALGQGIKNRKLIPVLSGSNVTLDGMHMLLKFIALYMPKPEIPDYGGRTVLKVFKTVADPFVGKMSYFKVISGDLKAGMTLTNFNSEQIEKFGHISVIKGKKQTEVPELCAGDIGVVNKLVATNTGDVLGTAGDPVEVRAVQYPAPCLSRAIFPKSKGDEDKIAMGLQRISEEDRTFTYENNAETHEQVISGMGEMHLDVIASKLKSKFGVDVDLKEPMVPYREAIRKKVKQQGKHKKQSGGHGQYGDVWIEFEPYDGDEMIFEEKIFGGAVPKNFFPAVEKGLRECCQHGVLAGYPVVGLKATLVDGSYHDVDSSEMSFKVAASLAFKDGLKNASPVILEPIGELKVVIPDALMGDVIGDINKRRGQIMGMTPGKERGTQEVTAMVPMAEMLSYAIDLRSMTRGSGSFTLTFSSYQDAPANVAQQVIEAAADKKEE